MKKYYVFISSFIVLLSVALFFVFKNIPSGKLWKEYTVFYTHTSTPDELITDTFKNNGIDRYVGINNQKIPLNITYNSVEHSLFKLNLSNKKYTYLNLRDNYFFDFSKEYRLYYIPSSFSSEIKNCINDLKKMNIITGIDNSYSYSYLLPIIILCLFIIFIFNSKNKIFCILPYIIIYIYLLNNPFFSCAIGCALIAFIILLISNLWKRKGSLSIIIRNKILYILLTLSILCSFSANIFCGLLFLLCILASFSVIYIYIYFVNIFNHKKNDFVFSMIKPAKNISALGKKSNFLLISITSSVALIILYFFVSSFGIMQINTSKLVLPSNSSEKIDSLPTLEDYYRFNWIVLTEPYISINKNSYNTDTTVSYPRYKKENGIIREYYNTITYNDELKKQLNIQIDELNYESIEKVIKSEGTEFIGGYSLKNNYRVSTFSIISMFISFFMLLFIYFSAIIRKGSKK